MLCTKILNLPQPFHLPHLSASSCFSTTSTAPSVHFRKQRFSGLPPTLPSLRSPGLDHFVVGLSRDDFGVKKPEEKEEKMMLVRISPDRRLLVNERTVLTEVSSNVTCASDPGTSGGAFVGTEFQEPGSRLVVSLGTLRDLRFMACFRFKLWWMAQKMGNCGQEIPLETQFLLLELPAGDQNQDEVMYTVFLPIIEGSFRACIHGNGDDLVQLCIESGDSETTGAVFTHSLFIGAANSDPFAAITTGILAVKEHLNTFKTRSEKQLPPLLDYFGWCTWDAFYQDVTQVGVESGLSTLTSGGAPPKFVIIDDGWQSVGLDNYDASSGSDKPTLLRLTSIKENSKFQVNNGTTAAEGIKNIVRIAKEKYGLKYVFVWHALTGYWGGVKPGVKEVLDYKSSIKYPQISPTLVENEPGLKTDVLTLQGVGLVDPTKIFQFYDEMHTYLASAGVDGVKVDAQSVLETLGAGLGGRVELTMKYHRALDASVARNFSDNNIIACMSQHTEAIYRSKQTAVVRASDDFYPRDPVSHTIHIAAAAYNSMFLGEFMVTDWDMFHSLHPVAEYHASARAISGGSVYVSDMPGKHDFELLRKLVLPDGSILRARLPGRPTQDCLFTDPARDGISLLKIWNINKHTGVLAVFNCQGAAWNSSEKKNTFNESYETKSADALTCSVKARNVHLISEVAIDSNWNGDCVFYKYRSSELIVLHRDSAFHVSLKVLEYEIFTVSPIIIVGGVRFAVIGLMEMFNSGGAIEGIVISSNTDSHFVEIALKGCGRFGAYSSKRPKKCCLDSMEMDFEFDSSSGLVSFDLESLPQGGRNFHGVVIEL